MIVRIDDNSPVPPYRQLVDQMLALIAGGSLPVGQRLPPVRPCWQPSRWWAGSRRWPNLRNAPTTSSSTVSGS